MLTNHNCFQDQFYSAQAAIHLHTSTPEYYQVQLTKYSISSGKSLYILMSLAN